MKNMTQQKGFTLIELLIVILVAGGLLLISVFSLNGIQSKGRDAKRMNDINNLHKVMAMIKDESGSYLRACNGYTGMVSGCQGTGENFMLIDSLDSLATINDPLERKTACNATCGSMPCNYAFTSVDKDTYEVRFFLERSTTDYKRGCHRLTDRGVE
jgi:prepilin-type N-terminal cleavage/methylation domain-containing protein